MEQAERELLPCPLCGAHDGYALCEGSNYRWWSVVCARCGQETTEARATYPAETTPRTERADTAWNEAAAHAERLREALRQLLDDMGDDGHCVCEEAKQQAIAALMPNVGVQRLAEGESAGTTGSASLPHGESNG